MGLQEHLTILKSLNQIHTVDVKVQCDLELAALCRREFAKPAGGKGLYFRQLEESDLQAAANLFGSELRIAALLHSCSLQDFANKITKFLQASSGPAAARLCSDFTVQVPADFVPSCLQEVKKFDLRRLPAIRSWPGETGAYLTLGLAVTQHPETGRRNLGLYRAQILGANRIALNFAPGSGADLHLQQARALNQQLPVALFFGSDPALLWAAAAPLPDSCDEFTFCQQLFSRSIAFSECVSQKLEIPANAELVIEGQLDPRKSCVEGPFGNHTGQYVTRRDCPQMTVTGVQQKVNPVIPLTVVGPPPSENIYLARANQLLIGEMLKIDYPQIKALQMPVETIFHGASLLTVSRQNSAANRELIYALWQNSPLSRAKLLVLLDEDIALESFSQCWWRTINRLASERIYQDSGRLAIDATGVDPASLVVENQQTQELLEKRGSEYNL